MSETTTGNNEGTVENPFTDLMLALGTIKGHGEVSTKYEFLLIPLNSKTFKLQLEEGLDEHEQI